MDAAQVLEEFAILDIDFHVELLRLSGNELFASIGKALRARWLLLAIEAYRKGEEPRKATTMEHREIFRAIISGDPNAACEAARKHILLARRRWNERQVDSQLIAQTEDSMSEAAPKRRTEWTHRKSKK
jgi:DNA-binding FadR family transcriptional regulator